MGLEPRWVCSTLTIASVSLLLALVACSSPSRRLDRHAAELGLARSTVSGAGFDHVVYRKYNSVGGSVLHVYLDGDGTPWIGGRFVAEDPTPRNPLVLDLMAQDAAPSLYLARPCYSVEVSPPGCSPYLWTHGRYAPAIVASMRTALDNIVVGEGFDAVLLIGYSGGGTLAMLLAPQFPQVRAVVTIGANLDTDAWVALHGYTPLSGSFNPVDAPPLPAGIFQVHYVGARDANVPPALSVAALDREVAATVRIVPEFDHVCCWRKEWASILGSLKVDLEHHQVPG